ncbi:MAG: NAD-glutamate dehydrogenase [Gammaproteobacteria bacterium]|nr:MAG: NAD-glutamate dehydrogenase [Gammaproteobacteria bacterium]
MSTLAAEAETTEAYLAKLDRQIALRLQDPERARVAEFARLAFERVAPLDLEDRSAEDDASLTIDTWKRFQRRNVEQIQIEVANPVHARDGWQSKHTTVWIMARDMPFVVDSVLMALSHEGQVVHYLNNVVFGVDREEDGSISALTTDIEHSNRELLLYAEVDRLTDQELPNLEARLIKTIQDLEAVVGDFQLMKERLREVKEEAKGSPAADPESLAFLDWLAGDNFTFLGFRSFEYSGDCIRQVGDPLGVLRLRNRASERRLSEQSEQAQAFLLDPSLLAFSKSGTRSRVHRPAYPDYVGVRRFDEQGNVIGEHGFLGLYTSRVYRQDATEIPVVRSKVAEVMRRSRFDPAGFDGKVLAHLLATFPRDELFQIQTEELLRTVVAVTNIHERRIIRVFIRAEAYGLFVNCLVYLPRDLYNTRARTKIERLFRETFAAEDLDYDIHLSESIQLRLQYTIRIQPGSEVVVDQALLEKQISELISDWNTELGQALLVAFGEARGRRFQREYADAFPAGYREGYSPRAAADDVASIEQLSEAHPLLTRFYHLPEDDEHRLRLKVFHLGGPLPLSDLVSKLENMGLEVAEEAPYRIHTAGGKAVALHDFLLIYQGQLDLLEAGERFNDAFERVWTGQVDDDGFNRLILAAGLTWRQVTVLRSYARYLQQIRFGFSQPFISDTLLAHAEISRRLLRCFEARFTIDPAPGAAAKLQQQILAALEDVALLNEDRILRRILDLINATQRTNYYREENGEPRPYLSFKLSPTEIPDMPKPMPAFEIFVCAPHFEGVHLRGGPIARGGLRWSDRLEDYRTEVLGLVKAQIVKNGVIVPTGAKGGFVLKEVRGTTRDVVDCYRQFISGLLDLTDNLVDGQVVPPERVTRYDGDDPYLVVAADKGTATFSDEANAVSKAYGFWLGDAFASGGSNGYDHKAMGITARGAWVAVQRHFRELGVDVQSDPVTVLGIGDMGGDVFGNGMLLSESIQLVAAFNHLHIFIDPNPDASVSYAERKRLFAGPASGWSEYDVGKISQGGGVFTRKAKSIPISAEMKARFEIEADALAPDELVHELLKAPLDLIWNGGIGTYVKATSESHQDVGDRANDHLRVDASQLRARVFGEGGNLGLTQLARIEFALNGGSVNSDFIDNAAGVDSSDHEVNIKVALNGMVAAGDMTSKQRNQLLEDMTDNVAELVLSNNRRQTRTLSLARLHAGTRKSEYRRFITFMESATGLDRALEYLPSDEELSERPGQGLTRPELSVLLAYAKIHIKQTLVDTDIDQDPIVHREILGAVPDALRERHETVILEHPLRKQIIASQVANSIVDHMGITFVVHLMEFVGGSMEEMVRAYYGFVEAFGIRGWFDDIEAEQGLPEQIRLRMLLNLMRLGRRATRWILRHRRNMDSVQDFVDSCRGRVGDLIERREMLMSSSNRDDWGGAVGELMDAGVSEALAKRTARASRLADALSIIDAADTTGLDAIAVGEVFVALSDRLQTDWLSDQLAALTASSHWQAMERDALLDDVMTQQGLLAVSVLTDADGDLDAWLQSRERFVNEWRRVIGDAQHATQQDFSMFAMTCRKLADLSRLGD